MKNNDRIIKPIAFNLKKDSDLLEWIKYVEKTEKLNYAQYVKRLINQDMLNKKSNESQNIINNVDTNKLMEELLKIQLSQQNIPNNIQNENSSQSINISNNNNKINEEIKCEGSILNEDDFNNLNDIINGNF